MKKLFIIILLSFIFISCDYDSENKPYPTIQGENSTVPHPVIIPTVGGFCYIGKMTCIDNKSCICLDSKWIIIQDCSLDKLNCYFNNIDHTVNDIPYYAECD